MTESSSSEKALDYMQKFHDRDSEYFESKHHQREARQGFIDLYKLDQKNGEDTWNHMFPKFFRKNKLKKEDFLKTRFRRKISPEFKKVKIKAEPQCPRLASEKTPIETINEKIAQEHPQIAKTHQQEIDSDIEDAQQLSHHVSEKSIGYFWDGIIVLLQIKWKYIERLTDDERAVLGQMWRPFFTKYTSEKFLLLGIPAICTIGLVGKHILDSKSSKDLLQ